MFHFALRMTFAKIEGYKGHGSVTCCTNCGAISLVTNLGF